MPVVQIVRTENLEHFQMKNSLVEVYQMCEFATIDFCYDWPSSLKDFAVTA
jgi:hypothetical protein